METFLCTLLNLHGQILIPVGVVGLCSMGKKMNIISSTKDEQANSRKLKLYPNPTSGPITINGLEGEANVSIRNINGQILIKSKTISNQIDISVLRAGMYIIEIENGNLREWHKVVKSE